ncbi:MAG: cation:proton antiporter [Mangrovicoccus sp.]|nr:cation:proton antiporter [Mangrovicoccus sp.]
MTEEWLSWALNGGFTLILIAILMAFYRLMRGPTLPDRVVALDMMTISIVAFCALFSIHTDDPVFLDIAIVMALIGFLATVALARFAEREMQAHEEAKASAKQESTE